ncbi:hypothetical protein FA15DRAFT_670497 [Coprinopsis marcescibilis]|uniref:Large ribosomal subunit protein mL54 n=1 Tax=Coprinopsis marcescibilis TaxID=230819 RepID=A0A5C3KSQ3_COPMA|nr:hypothetical protein FA15DRAFT_670497 [Coprinopsis marcescibilis]
MSILHLALRSSLAGTICRRYSSTVASGTSTGTTESSKKKAAIPQSSCPPDTLLKGLNYLKGQPPVLALSDDQYPDWLWNILKPKEYPDDGPGGMAGRKQRKSDRQQAIRDRNFMSTQ